MGPSTTPTAKDGVPETHVVRIAKDARQGLSHHINIGGQMGSISLDSQDFVERVLHPAEINQELLAFDDRLEAEGR